MILAIETATNVCSVAFENEAGTVFEKRTESRGSHSEKLFLFIKALMEEQSFSINDLSAVLISEGPGSYTGLRIAASGVKGLLFGTQVPLYGVSTLASFAYGALGQEPSATSIHAIIDARRKHVYHQLFAVKQDALKGISEVNIVPLKQLEKTIQPGDLLVGTGINRLAESLVNSVPHFGLATISARSLITLYHQKESEEFIHRVASAKFDPKYFTSSQV